MYKDSVGEGRNPDEGADDASGRAACQGRHEAHYSLDDGSRQPLRRAGRGVTSQVLMGVLVIAIGLLFLLDNLDIIEVHEALAFWPLVFIFAGIAKLLDTTSPDGYLIGLAGIGIGGAMILNRLGIIYFSWRTMWPLILIAVGAVVVYRGMRARRTAAHGVVDGKAGSQVDDGAQVVDVTAVLGGFERRVHSRDFRGGEITAVMGGCTLDMRGASIQGEAVINVFAFWGGVTIKCPPDWTIILQGTPIMGGFEEKTVAPPDNSKRLVIRGYAIMGGVEVRN